MGTSLYQWELRHGHLLLLLTPPPSLFTPSPLLLPLLLLVIVWTSVDSIAKTSTEIALDFVDKIFLCDELTPRLRLDCDKKTKNGHRTNQTCNLIRNFSHETSNATATTTIGVRKLKFALLPLGIPSPMAIQVQRK